MVGCMQVTLQFLSDRLRMMPLSMLQQLVPYLQLQLCEQHTLIFNRDDDATTFYVVLSGARRGVLWLLPVLPVISVRPRK